MSWESEGSNEASDSSRKIPPPDQSDAQHRTLDPGQRKKNDKKLWNDYICYVIDVEYIYGFVMLGGL